MQRSVIMRMLSLMPLRSMRVQGKTCWVKVNWLIMSVLLENCLFGNVLDSDAIQKMH